MASDVLIPPNCSITPPDLQHLKTNALYIFDDEINKNPRQNILKQENWSLIIDYILLNQIIDRNTNDIASAQIQLLSYLSKRASQSIIPGEENKVIRVSHNHVFHNKGCVEFFLKLGFKQTRNMLIATNTQYFKSIITVATNTISKKIEMIQLYKSLHILWSKCMFLMQKHSNYRNQNVLNKIHRYDFSRNYHEYFHILNQIVPISAMNIPTDTDGFVIEILNHIGFNILLIYNEDKENKTIFKWMRHIYDTFNTIERLKLSIYLDGNEQEDEDMKLEIEDNMHMDHHHDEPQRQYYDALNEHNMDNIDGISIFEDILSNEWSDVQYEQLLQPSNWEYLIDSMCLSIEPHDTAHILSKLNTFLKTATRAREGPVKYRKIDIKNKTTKKKLLNIAGAMLFLRGLGFTKVTENNKVILYLEATCVTVHFLNVAIQCLKYKIEVFEKLEALHTTWRTLIADMYNDTCFLQQMDALDALLTMDLSTNDVYYTMCAHMYSIRAVVYDDHDKKIPMLMLHKLGIILNVEKHNGVSVKVLKGILSFYKQITKLEEIKKQRRDIQMMGAAARKILAMYLGLNALWAKCIDLMRQHHVFKQQTDIVEHLSTLDFANNNDYRELLSKITKVGEMNVYAQEIYATKQILMQFGFSFPQILDINENNVLKFIANIYHKVEEIENYKHRDKMNEKKLIRIEEQDKYDRKFEDNPDNVIYDFQPKQTPYGILMPSDEKQMQQNEEMLYLESMEPRERARARSRAPVLPKVASIEICREPILHCAYTQRVLKSLEYFQDLDIKYAHDQELLVLHFRKVYTTFLDDQIHVRRYHDEELHEISENEKLKCRYDLFCASLQRFHYDPDEVAAARSPRYPTSGHEMKQDDTEAEFELYRDMMDSIHCYMYHLFDIGLRVNEDELKQEYYDDENQITYHEEKYDLVEQQESYDKVSKLQSNLSHLSHKRSSNVSNISMEYQKRMSHRISLQQRDLIKKGTINLKKYTEYNKQKFKLDKSSNEGESGMLIDGLCEYLLMRGVKHYIIPSIRSILYDHEYDSDALLEDIGNGEERSNIREILIEHDDHILQFINFIKLSKSSFSIGFRFYYWSYYEKQYQEEVEYFQNKNFHSGYKPHELYIKTKYKNGLKQEILHNTIFFLTPREFHLSLSKAEMYLKTASMREITAEENIFLHYDDVFNGDCLTMEHLLSVTLYCDWSKLCSAFSATFRKNDKQPFEPINRLKKRNSEYANWSKRLRETVELYGKRGWEIRQKDEKNWNHEHNRIRGPFFCGMDHLFVMPEFSIRLCAPTSTSSSRSVACSFAGEEGIIIALSNDGHWHSDNLRIWDCSWLSDYKGEDEKLIFGGFYTTRIEGIRLISSGSDYSIFFKPLFYYDCMLMGISMLQHEPKINKTCRQVLTKLTNDNLDNPYVTKTFESYKNHRKNIVINLHQIHTYFEKLKHLVIESYGDAWECDLCCSKGNSIHSSRCWACKSTNSNRIRGVNNLLKISVLEQFRNLEHVVMYTTSGTGQNEYAFDLTKFFNNIVNYTSGLSSKRKVIVEIKATHLYKYQHEEGAYKWVDFSWLSREWERHGEKIQAFLISFNPSSSIVLDHTKNTGAHVYLEDTVRFTTINT